jgi:peptide/nickel transport system substrate-binding protein
LNPILKKFVLLILILPAFSLITSCNQNGQQQKVIDYGLTLAPSGIDPHINASAELGIPLSSVYDTLVFQNPETWEFVPGLAQSWTLSNDGLTYTFYLRQDVDFHDDTHFDANSVKANIEYILDPEHVSQKASIMLGPLNDVEVIDSYTVAFHLSEPYAPLLDSLAQVYLGMASPTALEKWGPSEYQFHQVGTGPYRFVEYIPNDHLTLEKNPDYDWGPSIYKNDRAEIDEIRFQFFEDPATRSLALESGEIDIIGEVPPHDAARLAASEDFQLYPVSIPGQPLQFFFNTQNPPTDDVEVRTALIQAVDRTFIVETIFGSYSPVAEGPLSSSTFGFSSQYPYPSYDFDQARSTLEGLGWKLDENSGHLIRDAEPLSIHIVAPNWGSNPEVGQLIEAAWEKLGAEVNLEVANGFGPLKEAHDSGEYHVIGINLFGTDPDLLRSFFRSDGFYNWSGYQDPILDTLLDDAVEASFDSAERQTYYDKIFALIRDEALILPIRDYVNLVIARSNIKGLRFSSQGWFPFLIDLSIEP